MPVGDVYQGSIEFTLQNNPNTYSWSLELTAEPSPELVLPDITDWLGNVVLAELLNTHTSATQFDCVSARQIWPTKSLPRVVKADQPGVLTGGEPLTLPGQCSLVATLFGDEANPTRFNRGRDFWTGASDVQQQNGVWLDAWLDTYQAIYETIGNNFDGTTGNEFHIGIFSNGRTGHPTLPDVPPAFFQLEAVRIKSLVRTQRRRQAEARCEEVRQFQVTV